MVTHLIRLTLVTLLLAPVMPDACGPPAMRTLMHHDTATGGTAEASSQSHFAMGGGTTRASSQSHFRVQ